MNKLLLLSAVCLTLNSSCATNEPRGPQGSFSVNVVPYFGNDVRVFIQAYERINGQRGPALASKRVTGDGVTGFVLPLGKTYGVHAYADLDADSKEGPADPSANLEGLQPVADVNMQQAPVVLTLPGVGVASEWPRKKTGGDSPQSTGDALVQKGLEKVREVAPQLPVPSSLPVPPPPLPVPPPPP